jgi:hypothetical protein
MKCTLVTLLQTCPRNVLQGSACCFLVAGYLLGVLADPEDGGSTFFPNAVEFYEITRHHIPEDNSLHSHHCEVLKSNIRHLF